MFWFEVMCSWYKDLSWYDVTATGDFASRMTEDLNKMQDGMGEKVLENHDNTHHYFLKALKFYLFLKVGMLFRFIATGIGGFVYPFTQVEMEGGGV